MRRPDIPVLTTLRFPAAFAVMLYHFCPKTACPHWVWGGLASGVSFFYVLSGFILYYNYNDLPDRGVFWMARLARVWPLHLATLVLAVCLLPLPELDGRMAWPLTLPLNIVLFQAWVPSHVVATSWNGVAWSLSVEGFFYAAFPWLLAAVTKRGPVAVLTGSFLAGLFLVVATTFLFPARAGAMASFNPICRVAEFVLGMVTCQLWIRERASSADNRWLLRELAVLILALGAVVGIPQILQGLHVDSALTYWLGTDVDALCFALVIWIFAHQQGAFSRFFSARAFEWFGEISFAFYMCHQLFIRKLFPDSFSSPWEAWRSLGLLVAVTLAVSAALFHFVETPARKAILSAYKSYRRRVSMVKTSEAVNEG